MKGKATAGAVVPVIAQKALSPISEALTADLAVIRTQTRPRGKRAQPIEVELHLNPAALAVAAVGGALTLWLVQLRVSRVWVSFIDTRYIDKVTYQWDSTPLASAYLPEGYSWSVVTPVHDYAITGAQAYATHLANTLPNPLGLLGLIPEVQKKEAFNAALYPYDLHEETWTEQVVVQDAVGHWEKQFVESGQWSGWKDVWVIDVPAVTRTRYYNHVTGHCYKTTEKMTNSIQERTGFTVGL